jgi:hypothetical protein
MMTIFGYLGHCVRKKIGDFCKKNCIHQWLLIFSRFFGENYFKIITMIPGNHFLFLLRIFKLLQMCFYHLSLRIGQREVGSNVYFQSSSYFSMTTSFPTKKCFQGFKTFIVWLILSTKVLRCDASH